ncbi:MAG: SufE family protein [Bacteriovoracaceae bacterium]|nr:SufE family protein [Bacteriovoracaceae bacterium]
MSIGDRIEKLVGDFDGIKEWEDRYKHIITMGKSLPAICKEGQGDQFKIKGCQSQVWVYPGLKDGVIHFQADSDAAIVKGIVAMLVTVYSGSTPDEILATRPDFLEKIGIREHLSMSRANGLSSMLKQIQLYAYAFKAKMSM